MMRWPSRANRRAIAAPNPDVAPVTKTIILAPPRTTLTRGQATSFAPSLTRPGACTTPDHMRTTTAVTTSVQPPARHFDCGFRSAVRSSLPAVAAACRVLGQPEHLGTRAAPGLATPGPLAAGGTRRRIGGSHRRRRDHCVLAGTSVASGGTTGIGGPAGGGGVTGIGGSGGAVPLPACAVECADVRCLLRERRRAQSLHRRRRTRAAQRRLQAVGSGAAPGGVPERAAGRRRERSQRLVVPGARRRQPPLDDRRGGSWRQHAAGPHRRRRDAGYAPGAVFDPTPGNSGSQRGAATF